MLLSFSVKNFRSFHQKQTLDFNASRDKHNADNVYGEKPRLLKSIVLFGANASGKSNLVKAIAFMEEFVVNSATKMNEGDEIEGAIPFRLLSTSAVLPSQFEICLLIGGISYRYGFAVTQERVVEEWLVVKKPRSQETEWLRRTYDAETSTYQYRCDGDIKEEATLLSKRTRSNCLALSAGVQLNIEALKPLYRWFHHDLWHYDFASSRRLQGLQVQLARRCQQEPQLKARIAQMLRDIDAQIQDIAVEEIPISFSSLSFGFEIEEFMETIRDSMEGLGKDLIRIQTLHKRMDTQESVWFGLEDESHGTQRFLAVAGAILEALDNGRVLCIDEFECNMHPHLAKKIIAFFQHPEINKTGAQLVVTTHDSSLMHPSLLRRDQIWIAEKDKNNATTLFSLYDIGDEKPSRSTEIFQRHYLAGEYGGVPQFGLTFEYPKMPTGEG